MDDSVFDELVVTPPESFVARRNEIVADLKASGEKDAAAEVAKLRRPPREAWALNCAAREHPDVAAEWADAAGEARTAQESGSSDLRAALTRLRTATAAFVDAVGNRVAAGDAAQLLAESAMSAERAAAVAAGTLGFDVASDPRRRSTKPAPAKRAAENKKTAPSKGKQDTAARRADKPAKRTAEDRLARAKAALKEAQSERTKAEREESKAEAALDKAAAALAEAQERLVEAQREQLAARRRFTAAQRVARDAADRVADAERKVEHLSER